MNRFLRQTSDPAVEADLQETRPFFWFLILVLVFLYAYSIYTVPELRQAARFLPFTALFFIHIALHWYMPYLVEQQRKLAGYLVVQVLLITLLIVISDQSGLVLGLYATLAGETIGVLDDWRRSLAAVGLYLLLMGLTYGLLWGWATPPDWLLPGLIVMLFVLVYVLLFLRQLNARTESQRLLAELQEAHAQLATYATQVETLTLEAERQRMARELHDTLAQGLAGLVLQLEALEASLEKGRPQQAEQIAAQAKERARATLAEARLAIEDLRSADRETAERVSREVERFRAATGMPCTLQMPQTWDALPAGTGEQILRCVSEGLANVTRHARATEAWVTITQDDNQLLVQVHDNGQGFEPGNPVPGGHYGLLGLRERARLANGRLQVESTPGEGTTVTMILPLARDEVEPA